MQFTVKSNHSMDKNCLKFIPIALFSCKYKCKKKGKNADAELNKISPRVFCLSKYTKPQD